MQKSPTKQSYRSPEPYVGRFAPSPTGPLHFGSLVSATASYLDAKHHQGKWLLRIEDIDPPREQAGAADSILKTLAAFGLEWDGQVIYQSQRQADYQDALTMLLANKQAYYCQCTRKQIAATGLRGKEGFRYPGTCRQKFSEPVAGQFAIRFNTDSLIINFEDQLQATAAEQLDIDYGDFALKRADGLFSYQLAVGLDDARDGITHIVRGADLLTSTSRQIALRQSLGKNRKLQYSHIPLAKEANEQKLSKQNLSTPVSTSSEALWECLHWLEQSPPQALKHEPLNTIWEWAIKHWNMQPLAGVTSKPAPTPFLKPA